MGTKRPVGRGRMDVAVTFAVLALCAAIVAAVAWTRPTTTSSTQPYTQTGSLAYSAPTSASSVYGATGVTTGEPVYRSVVSALTVTYTYQFQSDPPATINGVEQLTATLSNPAGLSRSIPLQAPTPFTTDHFTATGTLSLAALDRVARTFDAAAGVRAGGSYQLAISPAVHLDGSLASGALRAAFNPATTFNYGSGLLAPASAGGTLGTPTQQFSSTAPGSVVVANGRKATLVAGVAVETARIVSLAVLLGSLLVCAVAGIPYWRRTTSGDEVARITSRHGASIVEADAVQTHAGVVVVELTSFDGVLQVSRRLECPVLHWADGGHVYVVVDGGTLYQYRPQLLPESLPLRPLEAPDAPARRSGWTAGRDG